VHPANSNYCVPLNMGDILNNNGLPYNICCRANQDVWACASRLLLSVRFDISLSLPHHKATRCTWALWRQRPPWFLEPAEATVLFKCTAWRQQVPMTVGCGWHCPYKVCHQQPGQRRMQRHSVSPKLTADGESLKGPVERQERHVICAMRKQSRRKWWSLSFSPDLTWMFWKIPQYQQPPSTKLPVLLQSWRLLSCFVLIFWYSWFLPIR